MTFNDWRQLAILSVRNPADAAQTLMAMRIPGRALWTALMLMAVLNTVLFTLSNMMMPWPNGLPRALNSPVIYLAVVAGGLILTVWSIFWTGRVMGGKGSVNDVLVLIVWMQALRVAVQAVVLVLTIVAPAFAALLVIAVGLIGVYMLVHFVDQAHRIGSPGKAIVVVIASLLAIVVGLSVFLMLVGGPFIG